MLPTETNNKMLTAVRYQSLKHTRTEYKKKNSTTHQLYFKLLKFGRKTIPVKIIHWLYGKNNKFLSQKPVSDKMKFMYRSLEQPASSVAFTNNHIYVAIKAITA